MTIDTKSALSRRVLRASAVSFGLALGSLAVPALAAPPEAWEEADNGSLLNDLMFLLGVPVLVFVLLTLAVYLPSMMRKQEGQPALAFRERPEWFGGPRKGVDAASGGHRAETGVTGDKGGASAQW